MMATIDKLTASAGLIYVEFAMQHWLSTMDLQTSTGR